MWTAIFGFLSSILKGLFGDIINEAMHKKIEKIETKVEPLEYVNANKTITTDIATRDLLNEYKLSV